MQAIILAAGRGRRMEPLSGVLHKALLPVAGTTILGRIMDGLVATGVTEVTVVTGYRAEDVEGFLRSAYPMTRFHFLRNERYDSTNNVVSLSLALDQISFDKDLLLVECDLLFDASVLARLKDHPGKNVALLDRYRTGMDGTVVAIADGLVTQVFPPHLQGRDFNYADKFKTLNIYRFDRHYCRDTLRPMLNTYANVVDPTSYYEVVVGMLANVPEHRIAAEVVEGDRWVEVDDPNDLEVARFRFEPSRRAEVLDRTLGGGWNFDVLDFAFMRNAYFPTEAMFAAMRHALTDLAASYGSTQVVLNEKLAYFLRCDPARLQVLHGATQAFPILRDLWDGRSMAVPSPTFGEYERLAPRAHTYSDGPGVEWSTLDRVADEVEVLIVVNPNNPTGTTVETAKVHALAGRHPQTTFLVDESFILFSGEESIVDLLEREPLTNVVVLTSLSKSLGVPGFRLGYLYSCDDVIVSAVGQELPVWNLSTHAEFLLELLLKFRAELATSITRTITDREAFRADLSHLPLVAEVHPSGGNFVLVRLEGDDPALAARLRRSLLASAAIEVKDATAKFDDGAPRLRLAVRTPADNERLLDALAGVAATLTQ